MNDDRDSETIMSTPPFRQYYGSGETWYLACEVDIEIERLTRERDEARSQRGTLIGEGNCIDQFKWSPLGEQINRLEAECGLLRAALPAAEDAKAWHNALCRLVALKDYKDQHGKDSYYEAEQPEAWAQAHRAVSDQSLSAPSSELADALPDKNAPAGLRELDALNRAAVESLPTLVNSLSQATGAFSQSITVIAEITAERCRQIEVERWSPEHDDEHDTGQLARAAACYAYEAGRTDYQRDCDVGSPPPMWPFENSWWKPRDRRHNLVRSAALIVAEIERLDRVALIDGTRNERL